MATRIGTAKRFIMAMAAMFALGAAACGGSTPTPSPADDLTDGYTKIWMLTRYAVDGVDQRIPSWAADNVFIANYDGTGLIVYGEQPRSDADTVKVDAFEWTLTGSTLVIDGTVPPAPSGTTVATLVTLTATTFAYEYDVVLPGGTHRIRSTYSRAVAYDPDASALDTALTNAQTMIWSLVSVVPAGVVPVDPTEPLDNLLILSTDGTGYLTRPDSSGQKGTTATTDSFRWITVGNDLVLETIGLDAVGEFPWSSTIVQATAGALVIRGDVATGTGPVTVTMTYAPFLEDNGHHHK